MKENYIIPAANKEQQKAINSLLARPLTFSDSEEIECLICHDKFDPCLMFEGQTCFTCTVDEHFEKLKSQEP